MKKLYIVLLFVLSCFFGKTQQLPIYSQYMFNPYVLNPAYAGVKDYYEAIANYRYQWVGITDAPRTYILSVNGPHKTKNIGLGGAIFADVVGPTSRTAVYGSYAYHVQLSNSKLSIGMSAGLLQFRVDGQKIVLVDDGDTALKNAVMTTLMPDLSMGLYWYNDKMYAGLSVPQFMQNRINFYETNTQTLSNLATHYFFNTGYKFKINQDVVIEPSLLVKFVSPVDAQITFGGKVVYRDFAWAGVTLRTQDAISMLVGYKTSNDKLYLGYSYDMTLSNLQNYSSGTHEILIAAKFNNWKNRADKMKQKLEDLEDSNSKLENNLNEKLEPNNNGNSSSSDRKALEKQDEDLRTKLRGLKQDAELEGFDSPDAEGFSKKEEYLKTLQKINEVYYKKQALDN